MQVHQPHQEIVDENRSSGSKSRSKGGSNSQALTEQQDLPIEGLIFPKLIRKGVGPRCYYCWTKTGYSVTFTDLGQYAKHVLSNHEGYSIYLFDEDVDKFKAELKALRKKERDYPKKYRQPPVDVNLADTKYYMKYKIYYEKNCHKKRIDLNQ